LAGAPPLGGPLYRWLVLMNVMVGTFMAVLDSTIVNVSLASITAAFGTSVDTSEWVITGYMLATAIMLPVSGWLADHFGYKKIYILALGLFTTGSLLCGLAWSESSLIAFRVVQALGAGLLMPLGMAIVMREFPAEQRGMVLGFWGIGGATSLSFGPLAGGYLINTLGWRSVFWINVPVGIFGMVFTAVVQRDHRNAARGRFDLVGFLSMGLFLSGLLLALSAGNARWNTGGWTSNYVLVCFSLAAIGLVTFLSNAATCDHPLIDLGLFRNYNFALANVILFIFGIGMFGSTFLMPLYLQNSLGYSALQTGAMFLPLGLIQGVSSPLSGTVADRTDPKIPGLFGISLLGLSLLRNCSLAVNTDRSVILATLMLRGLGAGFAFTPMNTIAVAAMSRDKMAQASGMMNITRQIGGSVGVAIMGAIEARRVVLHGAMQATGIDVNSPAVCSTLSALQAHAAAVGSSPARAASQARSLFFDYLSNCAFVSAVDDCFLVAGSVVLLALVPMIIVPWRRKKTAEAAPAEPGSIE
jgi:MFS transporter, DHA2 family, multidrug resistance protein